MAEKQNNVGRPDERRPRRAYKKPTLIRHGNLREITLNVGNKGNPDGGSMNTSKTHS